MSLVRKNTTTINNTTITRIIFPYLTLCILMDFPIHIGIISMELTIMHFKRSDVGFSQLCVSAHEGWLNLSKQCRP